jgi:hypothetical protein
MLSTVELHPQPSHRVKVTDSQVLCVRDRVCVRVCELYEKLDFTLG